MVSGTLPNGVSRQLNVFVFHDQAEDPSKVLKGLLKASKKSHLLNQTLKACSEALRQAPESEYWPFFDILEAQWKISDVDADKIVVWTVVSCLTHLGCLALLWERQQSLFDQQNADNLCVGLCTGTLAAAAAACVSSNDELVSISRELICVALRLGLEAKRRSHNIEDVQASWSVAVLGMSEKEAVAIIDRYHKKKNLPVHRQAYVSAVLPNSLTVSGPPSTLEDLFHVESKLSTARSLKIPIYAAFHAEHLLCVDIDFILGNADLSDRFKQRENALIGYPSDGARRNQSLRDLLRTFIEGCFQSKLCMRPETRPTLIHMHRDNCQLISIGQCGLGTTVQDWLDPKREMHYFQARADTLIGESPTANRVAITGYAGRFPQADTLQEFWNIVVEGKDVHEPLTRFDLRTYQQAHKGVTASPYGCFMKDPGQFDNEFFNMSPREAKQVDPIQRILLMITQEALEMAGYNSKICHTKRIGVWFGQTTDDYREANNAQDIDIFYVGGGIRAFAPGRLNYHYKWEGPSYSIDTACSSSLAALEFAHQAVSSGDCDIAIAGGGNLLSAPQMFSGLRKGQFTSTSGSCKTFDANADGYCRGEGVGVVILRRCDDAILEGDNIKGIVSSIVTNHSAHASSITHPHGPTQEKLFRRALSEAELDPADINYVEFHGTGTKAGDAAELSSVSSVFRGRRNSQLSIGAVKANVGHGEATAGVTSLIKGLLMIEHNTIPPHCGIKGQRNPLLDRNDMEFLNIPDQALTVESNKPMNLLLNNFNAAGGNTTMVLRQFSEAKPKKLRNPRSHYPITISAHGQESLRQNLLNLKTFLGKHESVKLCDLSYTTTARRLHFRHRIAISAQSIQSLVSQIEKTLETTPVARQASSPPVVFVFSGQGTQAQGIAEQLYGSCVSFSKSLNEYESLCLALGFPLFIKFLVDPRAKEAWTATQLQLGTVAVELALAKLWQSWGLKPGLVIGHSLGEYPALCIAGVLSIADMFFLVGGRAQLLERLVKPNTHAMIAVSQSAQKIEQTIEATKIQGLEISCYNAEESTVISGPSDVIDKLEKTLFEQYVLSKKLDVQYAFHSASMDPILEGLEALGRAAEYRKPRIPVASTALGSIILEEGVLGPQYLSKHARQPVRFVDALRACTDANLSTEDTIWIEVGPGNASCLPLLSRAGLVRDRSRMIASFSTKNATWDIISQGISNCYQHGAEIAWDHFHEAEKNELQLLDLPTYAFNTKNFWIPLKPREEQQEITPVSGRLTPLLHRVQKMSLDGLKTSIVFCSDLSDPTLYQAIQGHLVLGVPLCPSSVYSSMALDAATLLSEKAGLRNTSTQFEICRLDISRPLLAKEENSSSRMLVAASYGENHNINIQFSSEANGHTFVHAQCEIKSAGEDDWQSEWSKLEFLARSRIDLLEQAKSELHYKLQRSVIYRLFNHVVNYAPQYHGLKSIDLDDKNYEACALIELPSDEAPESSYSWHLIDTLIHLAGFVLNNGIKDNEYVFISTGWESLRVLPDLESTGTYKAYVKLIPEANASVFNGNIYMFSTGQTGGVLASCTGVRFVKMKLQSLKVSLGKETNTPAIKETKPQPSTDPASSESDVKTKSPSRNKANTQSKVDPFSQILKIISEESGVSENNISSSSKFSELGLDSILVTEVVNKIKEQIGVEISSRDFQSFETMADVRGFVAANSAVGREKQYTPTSTEQDSDSIEGSAKGDSISESDLKAKPVLIQGSSNSSAAPLFLLPPGSGQVSIYTKFPQHPDNIPMYGLLSPFATEGLDERFTFDIADVFIKAIREIRPAGPLHLGGYSIGGALAYEIARRLLEEGAEIGALVIIDCPKPQCIPNSPRLTFETLTVIEYDTAIVERYAPIPKIFKAHNLGSMNAFKGYKALPMPTDKSPKYVQCIQATRGSQEMMLNRVIQAQNLLEKHAGDVEAARKELEQTGKATEKFFFHEKPQSELGAAGWEELVSDVNVQVVDSDHESLFWDGDHLNFVTKALWEALAQANKRLSSEA